MLLRLRRTVQCSRSGENEERMTCVGQVNGFKQQEMRSRIHPLSVQILRRTRPLECPVHAFNFLAPVINCVSTAKPSRFKSTGCQVCKVYSSIYSSNTNGDTS